MPETVLERLMIWVIAGWVCAGSPVAGEVTDFSVRAKAFGSRALLEDDDAQRAVNGTPADDLSLDLRLLFSATTGSFDWIVDHQTTYAAGDSFAFATAPQVTLDQTSNDDDRRLFDLTWTLDDGERHALAHRFDRLALEYRRGGLRVTLGRQAVSWGSGIVFHPMDLFNPFAPTVVDRDYKAGDDLLQLSALLEGGGDIQLLAVARRDEDGDVTRDAGSLGVKWRRPLGGAELELMAGRHVADDVFGLGLRVPLGGALIRSDWVVTQLEDGGHDLSAMINLDYSFTLRERTLYVFSEYFHNGFGTGDDPIDAADLPAALVARLQRGEVFNLMRNYTALGARFEWHPLLTQSATLITNLDDGSHLAQVQMSWNPGDRQSAEAGLTVALGRRGEEFGGVEVAPGLTSGSGTRLYVRWVYHL